MAWGYSVKDDGSVIRGRMAGPLRCSFIVAIVAGVMLSASTTLLILYSSNMAECEKAPRTFFSSRCDFQYNGLMIGGIILTVFGCEWAGCFFHRTPCSLNAMLRFRSHCPSFWVAVWSICHRRHGQELKNNYHAQGLLLWRKWNYFRLRMRPPPGNALQLKRHPETNVPADQLLCFFAYSGSLQNVRYGNTMQVICFMQRHSSSCHLYTTVFPGGRPSWQPQRTATPWRQLRRAYSFPYHSAAVHLHAFPSRCLQELLLTQQTTFCH